LQRREILRRIAGDDDHVRGESGREATGLAFDYERTRRFGGGA
jgi:hypothetical protein